MADTQMSGVDETNDGTGAGTGVDETPRRQRNRLRVVRAKLLRSDVLGTILILLQLPGSTDTAASFEFEQEDHTLGNALRWIIMKK